MLQIAQLKRCVDPTILNYRKMIQTKFVDRKLQFVIESESNISLRYSNRANVFITILKLLVYFECLFRIKIFSELLVIHATRKWHCLYRSECLLKISFNYLL